MSTFGLVTIIVLPVLGGLIAWAGDVIGYRLGKSRRSLFGLRPRTTARLVGVAVGVALPLMGLATAVIGSAYARAAFFRLEELIRQQDTLLQSNRDLQTKVVAARKAATAAGQEANQRVLEANRSAKEAVKARRGLLQAQGELRRTRGQLNPLRASVAQLRSQTANLRQRKEELAIRAARLRGENDRVEGDLTRRTSELKARQRELKARQDELALTQDAVDKLRRAYLEQRAAVSGPVLFEPGYELVRAVVPSRQTDDEMAGTLARLVLGASEAAHERGVPPGPGGIAVKLERPLPPQWKPGDELPTGDHILRYVAGQLRASQAEKLVVSVSVWRRVFQAEDLPARVELTWMPYVLVFRQGEVIYAAAIDGAAKRTEIFNQLWNMVTKLLRREAQEKGLLPNPRTGEYGSLPADQLLEALDEIAGRKRPVRVEITAAEDTHNTGPLSIKIEVKDGGQTLRPTLHHPRG